MIRDRHTGRRGIGPLPEALTAEEIDLRPRRASRPRLFLGTQRRRRCTPWAPVTVGPRAVRLQAQLRARLPLPRGGPTDRHLSGTFAVLLTRDVGGLGPSWGYFIVAGGGAGDRRGGGMADEPSHGPPAGRGDGGDRPHRLG